MIIGRSHIMSRSRITASGDTPALLLSQEVLDQMGLKVGDEVDISLVERTLILRPLDEAERARRIENTASLIFERRKSAYEELAKGIE
jgi:antitoxin component of MazEF toxin-antitoxin module